MDDFLPDIKQEGVSPVDTVMTNGGGLDVRENTSDNMEDPSPQASLDGLVDNNTQTQGEEELTPFQIRALAFFQGLEEDQGK